MKPYYKCEYGELYKGDCLEVMPYLSSCGVKVDMVCTDPPYGTTVCKWDSVVPLDRMWGCLEKIACESSPKIFTATQPFTSLLVYSNLKDFKYDLVWEKPHTGQLDVKRKPLRNKEDVLVFYKEFKTYNPQMSEGTPYAVYRKGYKGSECYGVQKDHNTVNISGERYPKQILKVKNSGKKEHPTQKPVALIEYLIKTYTNVGNTVLDFTIGSGTTAVAAINTGRRFIGIEKEEKYCEIAAKRIEEAVQLVKNFEV